MLHSITLSLAITFGGPTVTAQFDVNPTFVIHAPLTDVLTLKDNDMFAAVAVPHVIIIDDTFPNYELLLQEELIHAEQWTALGPWFPLAYAATLGRPFEPYDPVIVARDGLFGSINLDNMWRPSPDLAQRCPLIRISSERGFQVLPCWTP